jgi:hypothetical protein
VQEAPATLKLQTAGALASNKQTNKKVIAIRQVTQGGPTEEESHLCLKFLLNNLL